MAELADSAKLRAIADAIDGDGRPPMWWLDQARELRAMADRLEENVGESAPVRSGTGSPTAELERLQRIEAAARAYVDSDPPRPKWRELTHALADPDQPPRVLHPIAGELKPQREPCTSFMPDGRSEICARCDWPEDEHVR